MEAIHTRICVCFDIKHVHVYTYTHARASYTYMNAFCFAETRGVARQRRHRRGKESNEKFYSEFVVIQCMLTYYGKISSNNKTRTPFRSIWLWVFSAHTHARMGLCAYNTCKQRSSEEIDMQLYKIEHRVSSLSHLEIRYRHSVTNVNICKMKKFQHFPFLFTCASFRLTFALGIRRAHSNAWVWLFSANGGSKWKYVHIECALHSGGWAHMRMYS